MPKIASYLKELLVENGSWSSFVADREKLKAQGLSVGDALKATCEIYFDNLDGIRITESTSKKLAEKERAKFNQIIAERELAIPQTNTSTNTPSASSCAETSLPPNKSNDMSPSSIVDDNISGEIPSPKSIGNGTGNASPEKVADASSNSVLTDSQKSSSQKSSLKSPTLKTPTLKTSVPGLLPPLPVVGVADFKGKPACSEVDNVRWVASNMEMSDPSPEDCPSAAAWNLMANCRRNPGAMSDFWKTTYPKLLPSRTQMEKEEEQQEIDGSHIVKVMDELHDFIEKDQPERSIDQELDDPVPAVDGNLDGNLPATDSAESDQPKE